MQLFRSHNGELVALALAAVCAWVIAAMVLHFDPGSADAVYVPGIAATAAVASTWIIWRLIAAYGRRLVLVRGAIAGALAGVAAHPVFLFLVLLRDAIAACDDSACISRSVLTLDGLAAAAAGSAVFSVMGLAILGPVTVPVGMLGGILATAVSGTRRQRFDPAAPDDDVSVAGASGADTAPSAEARAP